VVMTGSRSNVTLHLWRGALARARALILPRPHVDRAGPQGGQGLPVLSICRGMQELNVALGGTLATGSRTCPAAWTTARRKATPRSPPPSGIRSRRPGGCSQASSSRPYRGQLAASPGHRCLRQACSRGDRRRRHYRSRRRQGSNVVPARRAMAPEYWFRTDSVSGILAAFGDAVRGTCEERVGQVAARFPQEFPPSVSGVAPEGPAPKADRPGGWSSVRPSRGCAWQWRRPEPGAWLSQRCRGGAVERDDRR
jgi:hypothetical protein